MIVSVDVACDRKSSRNIEKSVGARPCFTPVLMLKGFD